MEIENTAPLSQKNTSPWSNGHDAILCYAMRQIGVLCTLQYIRITTTKTSIHSMLKKKVVTGDIVAIRFTRSIPAEPGIDLT